MQKKPKKYYQDKKEQDRERESIVVIKTNVRGATLLSIALATFVQTSEDKALNEIAKEFAGSILTVASQLEGKPIDQLTNGPISILIGVEKTDEEN